MMVGAMKKRRETTELATLEDLNTTHQKTLESLYDEHYDRIYAYCVHRLFCRTAAEDVTGQIFLAAARGIRALSGDGPQVPVGWLYAIATNHCNAYLRKNLRRQTLFENYRKEYSRHQNNADLQPDWTDVYGAIAQLKQIEQTVITLRFFETMEYQQIAAIIDKRETAVRVILHRGLKKLRKLLNSADCGFENRGSGHE
jgi:RNA polymerase sigma-70 factor (ECF subfamily)